MNRWRIGALVVAAVAGSAATFLAFDGPDYDNGPFGHPDSSYGWSTGADQGAVFTDGFHVLRNMGDRPVRVVSVAFESGEPGLELVGAKVAGLDRGIGAYQKLESFPPSSGEPDVDLGPLADAQGYVIPAGGEYATRGVELLLGVRKDVPGRATRRALLVEYEVDGDRSMARLVGALAVCEEERSLSCPPESGEAP